MPFEPTPIAELWLADIDARQDDRGAFASVWRRETAPPEWQSRTLDQIGIATNTRRGTLRGMHYQAAPHAQAKLVFVRRGVIHDVILDLRPEQPTFGQFHAIRLDAARPQVLLIPPGCAHGYLTLADDTELLYGLSGPHVPAAERGIRWDSPCLAAAWPEAPVILLPRDQQWPTSWQ